MTGLADVFKALGDETRLEIIHMLLGREMCVCDIFSAVNISQPAVSHHLKVLKQAGIVCDKREGKWIYYSMNPEAFDLIEDYMKNIRPTLMKKERYRDCD
ncbi:arsr-type transcription regulator hth motif [Lucifera butyrica]|uniref:Arsr-type transcription regulator hth motif n=1 Tax=Lucifera butyrica TaxID=1351585 RepID=A0A498RDH0_9FIRM|nr:metalloregulator ArsR/SmtB family transcription factor [Lucifera butyrica]VBB08890.1 arsr-type transcription regulator hth motif [Lucifera butyrica]